MLKVRWQVLMLIACLLALVGTQVLAQETTPSPEETPVVSLPETTEIPTEAPTEAPTVTPEATVEPPPPVQTDEPLSEQTTEPPTPPTATPVVPGLPPEPVLALLVRDMFDTGDLSNWVYGANWTLAANDTGLNLETSAADVLQLLRGPFINAAAQVSLKLTGSSVHLALHQSEVGSYSAALDATGLVTLYRAGVPVQSMAVVLLPDAWQTLRLSVINGVLRVAVNGVEVLAWQDSAPLPPGLMAVLVYPPADEAPFSVQLDDAFVWVPEAEVPLYPSPTPLPPTAPPVEPTPEPTAVVTSDPTAVVTPVVEPTAEITAEPTAEVPVEPTAEVTPEITIEVTAEATAEVTTEPTAEATPLVDPVTGKSLVYQQHIAPPGAYATAGDEPMAAEVVATTLPYYHSGDTNGNDLTDEGGLAIPTCGFNITATTWYKFTPATPKQYILHTSGSSFDTILVLYNDNGGTPGTERACNDDASTTDKTSRLTQSLTAGQTYWIRLGGYNGEAGEYQFAVIDPSLLVPLAPTTPNPAANASNTTPTFQWSAPATGVGPSHYEIQISAASNFSSLLHSTVVNAPTTSYSGFTFPKDGVYYWRLRSLNINRVGGRWSAAWKLTIDTENPAEPTLTAPLDGAELTTPRPKLSWPKVTGATRYRVSLTEQGSATSLLVPGKEVVTANSMTLSGVYMINPLQHGKTYEWNVVAIDAANNKSDTSATWDFTINLMNVPADGLAVIAADGRPTFTWYAAGFIGARYILEVNTLPDFNGDGYTSAELTTISHKLPAGQLPPGTHYYWRLKVLNHPTPGPEPADLPWRRFVITTAIPPTVTLLTPANAKPIGTDPVTFTWRPVAVTAPNGPFNYQLQVATDRTFASGIIGGTTTDAGVVTADIVLSTERLYYWRVRAMNVDGAAGKWSSVWSLTIDRTVTAAPTLKSPLDASETNLVRPVLAWNKVTGATRYRVHLQVKGSSDQLLVPAKAETTGTSLSLASTAVLATPLQHGQTYEWYVVALDAAGNASSASTSATREFTVNLMRAPLDKAGVQLTVIPGRPAFTWYSAGLSGASYEVQVAANPADLGTANDKVCTSTSTSCTLPVGQELPAAGAYYWRLLVNVAGVPQSTSVPVRTFVLSTTLPRTPTLVSPATNSAFNTEPTLTWKGPAGGPFSYEVQLANDSKFTMNPTINPVTAGNFDFTPASLDEGTYWWRVRALNADGAPGAWSAARSFLYDITLPSGNELKPSLTAPANASVFTGPTPRFTWRAVKGYKRYEIQLSTSEAFTAPSSFIVSSTSFTPFGPLLYTGYWWQVRVLDTAGNPGPWSDVSEVKIISARTAVPVLNRYVTSQPTLTWTPISWADQYEVQISYNSRFTSLVTGASALVPGTPNPEPPTSYTTPALPHGTYYWRVRAHNKDTQKWGAWSTGGTGSFQIDVP